MNCTHIIVDSTAHIPAALFEKHKNLHRVSLKVRLGDVEWNEDEIHAEALFARMRANGNFPQTSQPSPGDLAAVFERIADLGDHAVLIAMAGGLSGTATSAMAAARAFAGRIRVVDSHTTAIGMLRLANMGLALAAEGVPFAQIADHIEAGAARSKLLLLPDSLEYLRRGGRIGGARALIGTVLQIKSVLHLDAEGKIAVLDKVRTKARALQRMADVLAQKQLVGVDVVHIGAPEDAERLKEFAAAYFPSEKITVSEAGSVLAAHVGPRALALMYREQIDGEMAVKEE